MTSWWDVALGLLLVGIVVCILIDRFGFRKPWENEGKPGEGGND